MAMIQILIFLFMNLPSLVLSGIYYEPFGVPSGGPGFYAFNSTGGGPYTGVNDGRVLKYEGCKLYFVDFAFTSPQRTKELCDDTSNPNLGLICGRPVGLGLYHETDELYISDAYYGLCVVGPEGGLATQLATSAEGVPFRMPGGLDVDQRTGAVYFTDATVVYDLENVEIANRDKGRLLKYDPTTKKVSVLLRNLSGAGGVAVSKDSSFLLVSEYAGDRILKFWLEGPKVNTIEILLSIKGPLNLKTNPAGEFWAAVNFRTPLSEPSGVRISESGAVLEVVAFGTLFNKTFVTEVHEYHGTFDAMYVGSTYTDFGGIYEVSEDNEVRTLLGKDLLKRCPPEDLSFY